MKRLLISLFLVGAACAAMCQAPFTIVRPADGAKVREDVRVLIPKNSVPKTGYVGFFLDGKFLEAVVPDLSGRYYEYMLDTKGRGIEDGKHTLEAVLYVDYSDEPRIVDRSSVSINVSNKANIPLPPDGLLLRYKFQPDTQLTYTVLQRVLLGSVNINDAAMGHDPSSDLPLDYEKIRMTYGIENTYGNGDGLVRMQAAPLKNQRYAMYTPEGQTKPQFFWDTQMAPIYMKLTNTGLEVFGSVPELIPFQGLAPKGGQEFFADWPLPTLPTKRVKPGDVWQTRFQIGKPGLRGQTGSTSVINSFPARGEFKSLEWEMGHPCAKLYHVLAGDALDKNTTVSKRTQMDETIWFALDKGEVIKVVRNQTFDTMTNPNIRPGIGKGGDNGGGTGDSGGVNRGGKFGAGGGGGSINFDVPASTTLDLQAGKGRRGGFGGLGGNSGGFQNTPQNRGNGQPPAAQQAQGPAPSVVRLTIQQIFILEQ